MRCRIRNFNVFLLFSCDADPKVLAQYIIALIGNGECNDDLRASLEDKLKEFFDDRKLSLPLRCLIKILIFFFRSLETTPFIDRLFMKLNSSNGSRSTRESSDRFNAYSDEEDDDGDRNFKHRRQRSEGRDRADYSEQNKRRYVDDDQQQNNKYYRSNHGDDRRNQFSSFDRGRGRGSRGYVSVSRPFSKPPMCRDYMGKQYYS